MTRSRTAALTPPVPDSARDTDAVETPACRATSATVTAIKHLHCLLGRDTQSFTFTQSSTVPTSVFNCLPGLDGPSEALLQSTLSEQRNRLRTDLPLGSDSAGIRGNRKELCDERSRRAVP